jgi:hypothetical protein
MRRALSIAAAVAGTACLLLSAVLFLRPFGVTVDGHVERCGLPLIYLAPNDPPSHPARGEYEAWRRCRRHGAGLAGPAILIGLAGVSLTSVGWITLLVPSGPRRPGGPAMS